MNRTYPYFLPEPLPFPSSLMCVAVDEFGSCIFIYTKYLSRSMHE
jgi:hypothetical protein